MLEAMRQLALDFLFEKLGSGLPPDDLERWFRELRSQRPADLFQYLVEDAEKIDEVYVLEPEADDPSAVRLSAQIGFLEGAYVLARLSLLDRRLQLEERSVSVSDVEMRLAKESVTMANRLIGYEFVSPWLSLSQENHEKYKTLTDHQQILERDRIAVGNLLTAFRGLGIEIGERLYAAVQVRRTVPCSYKNQTLVGFLGTLLTNVDFPDDLAIGRAVSHGYGWLKRNVGKAQRSVR